MPIDLSVASKHRTPCAVASGPLAIATAIEAMHKPANDQALEPDYSVLVDLREMEYPATSCEMFDVREALNSCGDSFTCGIPLAVAESHLFLARITCSLPTSGGVPMRIVTGVDETALSACNDE